MTTDELVLLTVAEILELHAEALERHGGSAGVRDRGLLESAAAQPEVSFGGRRLFRRWLPPRQRWGIL